MAKQVHIHIPQPCHENWNEMSPTAQGAFCKSCKKNVIDFSTKTENEIYNIISNAGEGKLCGRFSTFQLEYPIRKTEIKNGWFNWRAIAASVAAFLSFGKLINAGDLAPKPKVVCTDTVKQDTIALRQMLSPPTMGKVMLQAPPDTIQTHSVLKGTVIDKETREALPFATVVIKDTKHGATTDFDGNFELTLDSIATGNAGVQLEVSYIGYEKVIVQLDEHVMQHKQDTRENIMIPLIPLMIELQDVEIMTMTMGIMVIEPKGKKELGEEENLLNRYDPKLDIRKKVREAEKGKKD